MRLEVLSKSYRDDELLRVYDVDASISFTQTIVDGVVYPIPSKTLISCRLEDGRVFRLYSVPIDIVLVVKKLKGSDLELEYMLKDDRETIFDVIVSIPKAIEEVGKHLKRVVIDSINPETYTYAATAEFGQENTVIRRKMIPSHAILLALLTHKPIYVRKILVDQQQEFEEDELEDDYSQSYTSSDYDDEVYDDVM